jgi:hypothetical protein
MANQTDVLRPTSRRTFPNAPRQPERYLPENSSASRTRSNQIIQVMKQLDARWSRTASVVDGFEYVCTHRALTTDDYWFDLDEYRRGQDTFLLAHLRFDRFTPSIMKRC